MSSNLVTANEVIAYIGDANANNYEANVVNQIIKSISSEFDGYVDRTLGQANYANEEYDGNGKQIMWLKNYPITGNMIVIEDDITLTAGNDNDYLCYNDTGKLYRVNKTWYYGAKEILITYTAGYVCTGNNVTLPEDVRIAALKQMAYEYSRFQHKDWGLDSITYPDGSRSMMQEGLLKDVRKVLDRYRRYTF